MKCYFEHFIITGFKGLHQHLCCPYFTHFLFGFGYSRINSRILFHQIPFDSLPKTIPKDFINLIHGRLCDFPCSIRFPGTLNLRHFKQLLIIFLHEMCIYGRQPGTAYSRDNVIIYKSDISVNKSIPPIYHAHIFLHILRSVPLS